MSGFEGVGGNLAGRQLDRALVRFPTDGCGGASWSPCCSGPGLAGPWQRPIAPAWQTRGSSSRVPHRILTWCGSSRLEARAACAGWSCMSRPRRARPRRRCSLRLALEKKCSAGLLVRSTIATTRPAWSCARGCPKSWRRRGRGCPLRQRGRGRLPTPAGPAPPATRPGGARPPSPGHRSAASPSDRPRSFRRPLARRPLRAAGSS